MDIYEQILEKSKHIDWDNVDDFEPVSITFPVPKSHLRSKDVSSYKLSLLKIENYEFFNSDLIICDENLKQYLDKKIISLSNILFLSCAEHNLKTVIKADSFIDKYKNKKWKRLIAIGGGVLINFGGYVAEQLHIDIVYIPTSIIAMSDASIGGKVRLNSIEETSFHKHLYKSFYEPSEIIIDPEFLNYLDDFHIKEGLAEVIKHAIYQSPLLMSYLLSNKFDPFTNKESLLKAILWTADLKRICLEIDPEESKNGSYKILRAAHDISDQLEEKSELKLSHGQAVEKAMIEDLSLDKSKLNKLIEIYQKLGIGYTTVLS